MEKDALKSPFFLFSHLLRNICQIAKFCHLKTKHCIIAGAWIAIIGLGHEARWSHQSTQIIIGCMSFMQNYSPKRGSKHLAQLYFSNTDLWWGCPRFSPHLGFRPKHGSEKGLTLEKKVTKNGRPDTLNQKMSNPSWNLAWISHSIAERRHLPFFLYWGSAVPSGTHQVSQ